MRHARSGALVALVTSALLGPSAEPPAPSPGQAIDYGPLAFFPSRWKDQGHSTALYPWEGKRVVLLTTTADLDRKVVGTFLDRLDAAWQYYADVVGRSPRPGKQIHGK